MPRPSPDRNREGGFTLIEVLVAFTILGFVMVALLNIFSTGLRNVKVSEDFVTATAVAESRLVTIGVVEPLVDQVQTGTFNERFRWESSVRRIAVGQSPLETVVEPFQVTVTVSWGGQDDGRSLTLTTLRVAAVPR